MKIFFPLIFLFLISSCNQQKENAQPVNADAKSEIKEPETHTEAQPAKISKTEIPVIVSYKNAFAVRAEIDGKIEIISPSGKFVEKREMIVQLDNRKAFESLIAQKEKFISIFKAYRSGSKNTEENKLWLTFDQNLDVYKLLPAFPEIANPDADEKQLFALYNSIKLLEDKMTNHFILAEKSGFILEQGFKSGQLIKRGQSLLIIGKDKRKVAKLPAGLKFTGSATIRNKRTNAVYAVTVNPEMKSIEVPGNYSVQDNYVLEFENKSL